MSAFLGRIFRVQRTELGVLLILGFLLFANSVAYQISNIVSVSGFLEQVGVNEFLVVWSIQMLLVMVTASAQSLFIDRFNRVTLLKWISVVFAFLYILLAIMFMLKLPGWITYSFLSILSEQQWFFFPLILWILASDIFFDLSQSQRLFPLLAAFGFIGEVVGLGISAVSPGVMASLDIDANQLLNLVVLLYLVAYFMATPLSNARVRQTRVKPEPLRETLNEGWGFVQEVPAFRFVMVSMVGIAVCVTIIEYHFLVMAEQTLAHDEGQFQTYFSIISLIQTFLSIGLQAFITSRLMSKMGLKNTFIVTPLLSFFSLVGMIAFPGLNSSSGGYLSTKVSWYTIDQSARKALQALVPEERRGRVSMFIDTYLFALGVIFGCILLGIVLLVRHFVIGGASGLPYLLLGLLVSVIAIWAIYRLRQVYDSSMFNWRLKRRQRTTSVLDRLNDDETIKRPVRSPGTIKKRTPLDKLDNIE